jgi:hypothetical protein
MESVCECFEHESPQYSVEQHCSHPLHRTHVTFSLILRQHIIVCIFCNEIGDNH